MADDIIEHDVQTDMAQPVRYVTFLPDGALDGCFLQVPPEEHLARMVAVTEEQASGWVNYRATDARDGVEPAPPAPPAPALVPQQVTLRQARLALLGAGKLQGVDAAIDALPSPQREAARIEWDYARDVERGSPVVAMMAGALGLGDAELDALFIAASNL